MGADLDLDDVAAQKWSGTGHGQKRMTPMSDQEFDAFCAGVLRWMQIHGENL